MSKETKVERKTESYAEIAARRVSYAAMSTPNTPNGMYLGKEFDPESPEFGKFVVLNGKYNRTSYYDSLGAFDSVEEFTPYFNELDRLMTADSEMKIYVACTQARDNVNDARDAESLGVDVAEFRAKRDAERAAEKAQKEEARKLRAKVADLKEKGVRVRNTKQGTEIALSGDMLEAFKKFVADNTDGKMPLGEFLTTALPDAENK